MEKICIVKRRQQYAQAEVKLALQDNHIATLPSEVAVRDTFHEVAVNTINMDNRLEFPNKKIVEEFIDNSSPVISIMMTKEQSELLQQSEYIKELLDGVKNDPSLDIKINADGQLALSFRFNDSLLLRMLCSDQVCQMLQVSRSFLQKLVHDKKLNSYKLGRLRRFLLEDILEYLSSDEDFAQLKKEQ